MAQTYTQLLTRARCWLRLHDWKRARRLLGNSGSQTCRYCGATRAVTLRPRRSLVARG